MATLYPTSGYAESLNPVNIARVWAADMGDVPPDAVIPLYKQLMKNWTSSFPPSIGDFRKAWQEWDYWAEVNRSEEADAPVAGILALMPPPSDHDGPHLRATRLQFQIHARTGAFICCKCPPVTGNGAGNTAIFSPDGKSWVCGEYQCDFRVPVVRPTDLPDTNAELKLHSVSKVTRQRAEAMARDFNIDTSQTTAEEWLLLFELLGWLDRQKPARVQNRRTYAKIWDDFVADGGGQNG